MELYDRDGAKNIKSVYKFETKFQTYPNRKERNKIWKNKM